jgi:hypothetical protein
VQGLLWAGGAVAVAAIWVVRRRVRRRRTALARLAKKLNLNYAPQDRLDLPARYRQLILLGCGHERRATDVISGTTARGAVSGFRYEYDVGFGAERATRRWTVAVIETHQDWPPLVVLPGGADGCPAGPWGDAVPDETPTQSAFSGSGRRVFCDSQDVARWRDRTVWESLTGSDAPCGLEVIEGLVAAYSDSAFAADTYEWLLHIVEDVAKQLEETCSTDRSAGDGVETINRRMA